MGVKETEWSITSLPGYIQRTPDEIDWLWNANLPANRDTHPAVWDSIIGFFEDAIVASCNRPGHLVTTPRELLKQLKHNGREPASAMKVIDELFQRGDIVRADTLKAPPSGKNSIVSNSNTTPSSTLGSIRSTLSSYIWGSSKPNTPSLDDPIVSTSSLKVAASRALQLEGATASAEIHTVKTFSQSVTCGNTKDAEAVIGYMVKQKQANSIFTDVTKDQPEPVLGVKVGNVVNESDKGILRTKAALERMEDIMKHLEKSIEIEQNGAIEAAKKGDKVNALNRLKKKKGLQTKLSSNRAAASKLSDVLLAVDEAESNREAVSALETGMASLKVATKDGVTADRIDSVAAEFDDAMAEQQEVRLAFETLNVDTTGENEELESELDELLNDSKETADAVKDSITDAHDDTAGIVDDAEEELAKLLAELPNPNSPDKVGAAVASASMTTPAPTSGGQNKAVEEGGSALNNKNNDDNNNNENEGRVPAGGTAGASI